MTYFDLTSEMQRQISTVLDQHGLQILNNFVLLSALQESNGQLSSRVHLFLLDSQYNVKKKQSFEIRREKMSIKLVMSLNPKMDLLFIIWVM